MHQQQEQLNTITMASSYTPPGTAATIPLPPDVPAMGVKFSVAAEASDDEFKDNYDLEGANEDEYSLGDKILHYVGGHIQAVHWIAIKAAVVFKARCMISKLSPMSKVDKETKMLELYLAVIKDLDPITFDDEFRAFLACSFRKKGEQMRGDQLYRYYLDSRSKMRSIIVQLLPAGFATMKSGKGFHDTCNGVMVKVYRQELSEKGVQKETVDQMLPPPHWEYKKAPWFFTLTVKIFRTDPQLVRNVVDVLDNAENVPESRASLKRKAQLQRKGAATPSSSTVKHIKLESKGETADHISMAGIVSTSAAGSIKNVSELNKKVQKQTAWAKVHVAKAMKQTSNVGKRLAKMDELEKSLNFLDRIQPTIGEAVYKARVQELAFALPNPNSFAKDVEVVVLDSSEDEEDFIGIR